jgi:hypothetical protein
MSQGTVFDNYAQLLKLAKERKLEVEILQHQISIATETNNPDQLCLVTLRTGGIKYESRIMDYDPNKACNRAILNAIADLT